jgi:hypothetical protein
VLGLEWYLVDGFVDFGCIFLQLGLRSLGFLDEVTFFNIVHPMNVYGGIDILLQEVLFGETLREEHKCFFL